ncbi:hypothetical protein BD770DRAFT_415562 [Pilaira anomala]|nr:hypothetical protein BD770DRAFT_415562 [Pilaira anomala]
MLSSMRSILLIVGVLLFVLESAQAFCIYNNVAEGGPSFDVYVQPENKKPTKTLFLLNRSFHKNIAPGGKECCHWSDKGCNETGRQNGRILFKIHFGNYVRIISNDAGGAIEFTGTSVDLIECRSTRLSGFVEWFLLNDASPA